MNFENLQSQFIGLAQRNPEKVAIEYGNKKILYGELQVISGKVASFFNNCMGENKNIFLFLGKNPEMIISILGILQSGGIFIPLDCNYPENRLISMIEEVDAEWIVVRQVDLEMVNRIFAKMKRTINVLVIDFSGRECGKYLDCYHNLTIHYLNNDSLISQYTNVVMNKHCYIYFTSGSTGKPKGVMGRHRSLAHFIQWEIKEFRVDESIRVGQFTSPSFDPYLRDIFVPLCSGGTVCIPEIQEIILNPRKLVRWIDENQISLIHLTPSLFRSLMTEVSDNKFFENLRYIFLAGESLRGNDIMKFIELFGDRVQLVNLYGPTETTLAKLFYRIQLEDVKRINIPVGKPIEYTEAIILDEQDKKCRVGEIGEVYIRTPFISSGYYRHPELTKEVFKRNPFSNNPNDIIYKTGDLGRILPDGNMELVGRYDHQVKIRGVRIELSEIENKLISYQDIKEAIVIAREDHNGDKLLFAYIVSTKVLTVSELILFLSKELSDHMIPAYFINLETMPLTPNGKIDRTKLPMILGNIPLGIEFVAARNSLEEKLTQIFQEVLDVQNVGIYDNFFILGGHSLKAASLLSKVYKELNVELSLKEIFNTPTVEGLAKIIQNTSQTFYSPIKVIEEKEYYPVSSAQKRLFILDQIERNTSYNISKVILLVGALDYQKVEKTFRELIYRHDSLRTSFDLIAGEPVQKVHQDVEFMISYLESDEANLENKIKSFINPFDLKQAPLFRVGIIRIDSLKHICIIDMHHSISDGTSLGILIDDFNKLYKGEELSALRIQYKDFAEWHNQFICSDKLHKQEKYWLDQFSSDEVKQIPILNLPTDYRRQISMTYEGDRVSFQLTDIMSQQLNTLATQNNATLYMLILTIYNIFLSKYTNQQDIVVGSPVAGRQFNELEKVVGVFINTLAMRNTFQNDMTFIEMLNQVKDNTLTAFENQDYPFEMLVENLAIERSLNRNPLFDTMFVLHNIPSFELENQDVLITDYEFIDRTAKFDLTLTAVETEQGLWFDFEYCTSLFKRETIERFAIHFQNMISNILQNPELPIADIRIMSLEEEKELLYTFNQTENFYPENKSIQQLFEEQVARTPEKIAIVCEGEELSYNLLNKKVNQLARLLKEKGIAKDTIVGLLTERNNNAIIGILAILKANGAYLPIETNYPKERIKFMLKESKTELILTQTSLRDSINFENDFDFFGEVINLDDEKNYYKSSANLENTRQLEDLVYIIYTSGSTGKPKGVMIEERGLINYVNWASKIYLKPNISSNFPLYSALSFDLTVTSIFLPLLSGNKIVIYPNDDSGLLLHKIIKDNQIQVIKLTPTHLGLLKDINLSNSEIRCIIVGGEEFKTDLAVEICNKFNNEVEIYNEYGPTETVVGCMIYKFNPKRDTTFTVPIGVPIDNIQIYLLDQDLKPVPIGVHGEIYISSEGIARGYINQEKLTTERFIDNPFCQGKRMYKTGDLAKWLLDGKNIEFVGRKDKQVKIRGFRIELGEIEAKLVKHNLIKEAIVTTQKDATNIEILIAYYVTLEKIDHDSLREFLSESLPDYMIPSFFVQLDKLPLTQNGKIDYYSLPKVTRNSLNENHYLPPETVEEQNMADIWSEILGQSEVGREDNFFELGGDSIKAIQIIAKANLQEINITVKDIFRYKTIANIFKNVDYRKEQLLIEQGEIKGQVKLSPIQHWFFEQELSHSHYWNQIYLFSLRHDVDLTLLEDVFKKIVEHHDVLRMNYLKGAEILQINRGNDEVRFELQIIDLSSESYDHQKEKLKSFSEQIQDQLNMDEDLLVRGVVFDLGKNGKRLMFIAHHMVFDAVSMRILLEDIEEYYEKQTLPLKTTSFKNWSEKLNTHYKSDTSYWQSIPKTDSLIGLEVTDNYVKDQQRLKVSFTKDQTEKLLKKVNIPYKTEINDILLAALTLALNEVFKTDHVLLALEGHGREEIFTDVNISRTVGWFTTIYPVYFTVKETLEKTIKHVKETLRKIPNKGLDYGVARYLYNEQNLKDLNPEIGFNYLGQFEQNNEKKENKLLSLASEEVGMNIHPDNQYPTILNILGGIINGKLEFDFSYNQRYFTEEILKNLTVSFQKNLEEIIKHCQQKTPDYTCYTAADFEVANEFTEEQFAEFLEIYQGRIEKINLLAPLQSGMLFYSLLNPEGTNYCEQVSFYIEGEIEIDQFKKSWQEVLNRHEIFRTDFRWKEAIHPVQIVVKEKEAEIYEYNLMGLHIEEQMEYLQNLKVDDLKAGFDFENGRLNRLILIRLSNKKYYILWTFHHILLDGWSSSYVMADFINILNSLEQNLSLPAYPAVQYSDYLRWIKVQNQKEGLQFWDNYLADLVEPTYFAKDTAGPRISNTTVKILENKLNAELTEKIINYCKMNQITINALIQSAWGILLMRYNNLDISCFGTTVSGRPGVIKNVDKIAGLFINTLPIIVKEDGNTVHELLKTVHDELVQIREYEYISLAEIKKLKKLENRDLFDSILVFENYPIQSVLTNDKLAFTVTPDSIYELTNYDLTITVNKVTTISADEEIVFKFAYNSDIFNPHMMNQIVTKLDYLIEQMIEEPNKLVRKICLLTEEDTKLLNEFNKTTVNYPKQKTIQQLFEEQVDKTPDNIAVVFQKNKLSYRDLNQKANQLAKNLSELGIRGKLVGIMCEPAVEMIIGILATIKAGGAYVPIESDYPQERIKYMIEDCQIEVILTNTNHKSPDKIDFQSKWIDLCDVESYHADSTNLKSYTTLHDLLYVIYTSGSTGKPKGVMIEHINVNRLISNSNMLKISDTDRILQTGSLAFDASTFEIWGALLNGASLYLTAKSDLLHPERFLQRLRDYQITMLWLTAPLYNQLVEENVRIFSDIRCLIVGGDVLSPKHINRLRIENKDLRIVNGYGPTESTTFTTYFEIEKTYDNRIPIGKPVSNTKVHIVDRYGNLQPVGFAGELCIAGDGLARGYLNLPDLTQEKFVQSPFSPAERIYRTGDLAEWLEDGNIDFLGRIDQQVKIRGFRIEPGEIENQLLTHQNIKEVVVIPKTDAEVSKNKYLIAYFVSRDVDLARSDLRNYLKELLPDYMIPAYFVKLDKLPLTPNGKIDQGALPDIEGMIISENEYMMAETEIEEKLVSIFSEVLGVQKVGINDNFFDLGGDSIKAIQLSARLQNYHLKLEIIDLFEHPVIRDLAKYVYYVDNVVEQGIVTGEVELTPIQRWFFKEGFAKPQHFNQAVALYRATGFDEGMISKVLSKLVEHHDGLRMVYQTEEVSKVRQFNRGVDQKFFDFEVFDLLAQKNIEEIIEDKASVFQRSIDLTNGPLVKVGLFKTNNGDHLLIIIHHLVVDGVSWRILLEDFALAYEQLSHGQEIKLPLKTDSYKKWSEEITKYAHTKELLAEIEYWQKIEATEIPTLPKDYMDTRNENNCSEFVSIKLSYEDTQKLLQDVHQAYHTMINDILLATLGLAIKDWSANDKVAISLEGHGRENIIQGVNIDRTVGWFTSIYPVILEMYDEELSSIIKSTKENLRHIPNNGIGYGILKYITSSEKDNLLNYKIKPEISFNYLGQFDQIDHNSNVCIISNIPTGLPTSLEAERSYTLNISGMVTEGSLEVTFSYNRYHYDQQTLSNLAETYKRYLLEIIKHCEEVVDPEYTPSDFDDDDLSVEELDCISEYVNLLE